MIVNEISLVIQNIISEIQMIKRESTGKTRLPYISDAVDQGEDERNVIL